MEERSMEKLAKQLELLGSAVDTTTLDYIKHFHRIGFSETQAFQGDDLKLFWRIENGELASYQATLKKYIEIAPGMVEGIDVQRLENSMKQIDWRKGYFVDDLHDLTKEEVDHAIPLVEDIYRDLSQLYNSEQGKPIFDQLALKYLAYTVNEEAVSHIDLLKKSYERTIDLLADKLQFTTLQAYNLLDGRAVFKNLSADGTLDPRWLQLDENNKMLTIPEQIQFDLDEELQTLPIKGISDPSFREEVMEALKQGNKQELDFIENGTEEKVKIFADPLTASISLEFTENKNSFNNLKSQVMTNEELDRLHNNVRMHGFDASVLTKLDEEIKSGKEYIQVTQKGEMDNMDDYAASLHFHNNSKTDHAYFNRFDLSISPKNASDDVFTQSFDIAYKEDFTLREAYNLMKGRAVSKELKDEQGQLTRPWVKMDLEKTVDGIHPIEVTKKEGEYVLGKELEKYPIRNWHYPVVQNELIRSLERGNLYEVAIEVNGKDQMFHIAAAPEIGSLHIYDKDRQKVPAETLMKGAHQLDKGPAQPSENMAAKSQPQGNDRASESTEKRSARRSQDSDDDLEDKKIKRGRR